MFFLFIILSFFFSPLLSLKSDSYCITSTSKVTGPGVCNTGDIFLKGQYIELGVNNMGSFGTNQTAPSTYVSANKQLGFIADYDQNGFTTTSPGYAGDYFVPGIPLEGIVRNNSSYFFFISLTLSISLTIGWITQWTSSSDATTTLVNEGLMGRSDILPTAFMITSTDISQSSLWIGKSGGVQISMITEIGNTNLFFTTSVTIQNIGTDVLSDVYCKLFIPILIFQTFSLII